MRARIGLAFSLLALALFGTIGALSALQARRDSEHHSAAALQQLADRLAQRLDADMAERYREVGHLAGLEGLLEQELEPARWRVLLERLQRSVRHYSWIGLASRDGKVLAATQGLLEGRDVQQRPWFRDGLQHPAVGNVHEAKLLAALLPAPATAEPLRFVDVAAPLPRRGQTFGVIGAHLSWAWAEERRREALALVAPERALDIVLVDRSGAIVLGPAQPVLAAAVVPEASTSRNWSDDDKLQKLEYSRQYSMS